MSAAHRAGPDRSGNCRRCARSTRDLVDLAGNIESLLRPRTEPGRTASLRSHRRKPQASRAQSTRTVGAGRSGLGKSRIAAAISVYLACFVDTTSTPARPAAY